MRRFIPGQFRMRIGLGLLGVRKHFDVAFVVEPHGPGITLHLGVTGRRGACFGTADPAGLAATAEKEESKGEEENETCDAADDDPGNGAAGEATGIG